MRIAFLTEMGFEGRITSNHPNMRTEFAWMYALNADHYNIHTFDINPNLVNYNHIFIIFPKGKTFLSSEGSKLIDAVNPVSELLSKDIVNTLKHRGNKNIHYLQEGPHWWYNDYEIVDQIHFYNLLSQCDSIYAHNEYDVNYYRGMFSNKEVKVMPTLMIEDLIKDITTTKDNGVIIGGNFARWYGGLESYMVATEFGTDIWAQTSHAKRDSEDGFSNLKHLPRLLWIDWMKELSKFKYAVHLMPTVAAGTFSLNCAYFGIPCIGNEKVDTQRICHPQLSVDVADVLKAKELAVRLRDDYEFYRMCSETAIRNYRDHYKIDKWKSKISL